MSEPSPDPKTVQVSSPVDVKALENLPLNGRIQFGGGEWTTSRLSETDFSILGEFIESRRDVTLRAFGLDANDDLEFLKFFCKLRRFSLDNAWRLERLEGLRHLSGELEALSISDCQKTLSLRFLERFKSLRQLWLGELKKDIDSVSTLACLEEVSISSITLPDLSILVPLKKLCRFQMTLGGTKDLGLLPECGKIRWLGLYMIKGLEDLSAISELEFLEHLILSRLDRVPSLPSMKRLNQLKRVELAGLKSVTDLSPLLDAKQLSDLVVENSNHLKPSDFECLKAHPSLERLSAYLGTKKANDAVRAMFGLPDVGD